MTTPYTYTISPDEINVGKDSIARILGYPPEKAPEHILHIIEDGIEESKQYYSIKGGFIIIDYVNFSSGNQVLSADKQQFNIKKIIYSQIKKSVSLAVFVCTIGPELEKNSRELIESGEPLIGFILDAIASESVEQAADIIQHTLSGMAEASGLHITNRFSPGYCGWDVSEQQKLFSLLPQAFCGVRLTPSSLMIPIKSVSGIIGMGKEVKKNDYPCKTCDVKDCIKRRFL